MDNIAYLNQIAKDNRAVSYGATKEHIIDPKWIKVIVGAVVAVILMMIIGMILGNLGHGERDTMDTIYLRTKNLDQSISTYNDRVKSSELRSMGNSLATVLRETNAKVAGLLSSEYGASGTEPRDEATRTS